MKTTVDFVGNVVEVGSEVIYSYCAGWSGETKLRKGVITEVRDDGMVLIDGDICPVGKESIVL